MESLICGYGFEPQQREEKDPRGTGLNLLLACWPRWHLRGDCHYFTTTTSCVVFFCTYLLSRGG